MFNTHVLWLLAGGYWREALLRRFKFFTTASVLAWLRYVLLFRVVVSKKLNIICHADKYIFSRLSFKFVEFLDPGCIVDSADLTYFVLTA